MEDAGSSSGMSVMLSAGIPEPSLDDDIWSCYPSYNNFDADDASLKDSAGNSPSSLLSIEDHDSTGTQSSTSSSLNTPLSSSFDTDFEPDAFSLSLDLMSMPDPSISFPSAPKEEIKPVSTKRPVLVRKRMRECSMVCWLFRTLLTSEYRALPLNAIFEIFEDTNPSSAHGRHWRQSIRHCLMSSTVFVRVLTPNPRKDFLVMNEAGSWWTVHPDCEAACAEDVFRPGLAHKCPPNSGGGVIRVRTFRIDNSHEVMLREQQQLAAKEKWKNDRMFVNRRRPILRTRNVPMRSTLSYQNQMQVNPSRGDHLVVDHEEVGLADELHRLLHAPKLNVLSD